MSFNNQGLQPSSSQPIMPSEYKTMWQTNEPIDVDSYQPTQSGALPIITKVESISSESAESDAQILKHVCNALGVDSSLSVQRIREEIRKKHKPGLLCHPNLKSPKSTTCKAIFISQLPFWFEFSHVKTLIQLKSDFDVNWGSYYIDMFKNVQNKNTGECLLRFMENKDCIQVFKDLHGIVFSEGPIIINLDLDHEIANVRDHFHPNFTEQFGNFNGSGQNIVVKTEMSSEDDVQFIEPNNIKIEIPENINTSSIKQEGGDELNTSETSIKTEGGVIDMDIEENSPTQENKTENNKKLLEEQYQKYVQKAQGIQACRIVHLKNLDPSKKGFFHPTLKDFISKTMGKKVNFQYRRVINDKQDASGDVLLSFTSHRNAAIFCRLVNTSKDNTYKFQEFKYLAALNSKIEAIMGVGYTLKSPVTTTDLRLYQLKRKLMEGSDGEKENPDAKKAKADASTTNDDSKTENEQSQSSKSENERSNNNNQLASANERSNDQRSSTNERSNVQRSSTNERSNVQRSTSANERSNDHRSTSANDRSNDNRSKSANDRSNDHRSTSANDRSNDHRSISSIDRSNDHRASTSAKEDTKDKRASSRTNEESSNRDKTSRASDYETGVMTVDEREFSAFGLSKEFIRKHCLRVPFSRTVVVSHLHPDVNEAKLMEVFSLAGEVKKIDYNRSRNVAKIEFDHSLDAVQAISMLDKQKLYNRSMVVEMDELPRRRTLPEGLAGVGPGLAKGGQILRGCRVQAEVRRLYEHFVDLGTMEREREEQDSNSVFKFKFNPIKPKDRKALAKTCDCCRDSSESKSTNKSSTSDSRNKSSSSSNTQSTVKSESSSKDSNKGKSEENIPEGTLLAIQALGTVLVAQGLIPASTNCKSLQSILGALQKNTATQQNLQNTNTPNMNPANLVTVIPNRNEALNQALSNVVQFMSSNATPQANVAPNIQNVAPVPAMPAPVQPRPPNIHQGNVNVQPVAPYGNPRFPSMPVPVATPIPTPVRPAEPRAPFATPVLPAYTPAPPQMKTVQPAYDQLRTNLRAVPTIPPQQMPRPQIPPQQIPRQQIPPQQKPETVQKKPDSANYTKTTLDKEYNQSKENLKNSKMLVFKDLPACVTVEILQGKMNEVGEVKFCEMTGRGRAFVRFSNPQDADRCIRLFHRSKVDGQVIQVSFL